MRYKRIQTFVTNRLRTSIFSSTMLCLRLWFVATLRWLPGICTPTSRS